MFALSACSLDESGLAAKDSGVDVDDTVGVDVTPLADGASDVVETGVDAPPDAPPPACNPTSAFGSFVDLAAINSGASEVQPTLTGDELQMVFGRSTSGSHVAVFHATRTSTTQPFGNVTEMSTISSGNGYDSAPDIDDALKLLYFDSIRNGNNKTHIFQAAGNGGIDGWTSVVAVTAINSLNDANDDIHPYWSSATSELWFSSDRFGSFDIYSSAGGTLPPGLGTMNGTANDVRPTLSRDGLTMFFARDDSKGAYHIWATTRLTAFLPFGIPMLVTEFDSGGSSNLPGWLSNDGCRMYFTSDRSGGKGSYDLWMATR